MRTIALLTDFGLQDGYVGVMKGAIATISGNISCIDITHSIPPQNLWAGRFCLMNSAPYFPAETIFLGVADPGVGSKRRSIAIQFEQGFFVGPDNGLASGLFDIFQAIAAVELNNPEYWRSSPEATSQTFHGRDIFAPVAAHLATNVPLEKLGSSVAIADLTQIQFPAHTCTPQKVTGTIQHIDHFGNLITNIPNHCAQYLSEMVILNGDRQIPQVKTYSDVNIHELCLLQGSHGWLEISANQASAHTKLALNVGKIITITPK